VKPLHKIGEKLYF